MANCVDLTTSSGLNSPCHWYQMQKQQNYCGKRCEILRQATKMRFRLRLLLEKMQYRGSIQKNKTCKHFSQKNFERSTKSYKKQYSKVLTSALKFSLPVLFIHYYMIIPSLVSGKDAGVLMLPAAIGLFIAKKESLPSDFWPSARIQNYTGHKKENRLPHHSLVRSWPEFFHIFLQQRTAGSILTYNSALFFVN
jgi:hypothetical protein